MAMLRDALRDLLGPDGVLDAADEAPYLRDWRGLYQGRAAAVIRPADTQALAAAVRLCAQAGAPMVPQGGNTGLVGGATPGGDGSAVVVSLARLARLRAIDPAERSMTIEAGATLRAAQDHALAAGCLLPLSIAAEGSATIGGVLATNAGGNHTLRHGNARDLVLGLEVVLPDGRIWNGLRRLRKDNTGYSLRHLFVGSEGTLGIITAAVLALAPLPARRELAFCALPSAEAAMALLGLFTTADAAAVLAFEYISATALGLVLRHIAGAALPCAAAPHYVLVELAGAGHALRETLEAVLEAALEAGIVIDAAVAESEQQSRALWRLREDQTEAQQRAGASVKNDISVPLAQIPALLGQADAAVRRVLPDVVVAPFGHLGDGNIHFNLVQPDAMDPADFLVRAPALMDAVNQVARALDGSFSAEHGIGQLKAPILADWRGGPELDLMRSIKQAIDPKGMMNPGKIFSKA